MSRHSEAVVLYLILKLEVHKDKGAVWKVEVSREKLEAMSICSYSFTSMAWVSWRNWGPFSSWSYTYTHTHTHTHFGKAEKSMEEVVVSDLAPVSQQ